MNSVSEDQKMPEINEYERQRLDRIAANKAKIAVSV